MFYIRNIHLNIMLRLNLTKKKKITNFFVMNIRNYRLLPFEDNEKSKQIYKVQLSNKSQTKLNKGVLTPLFWVDII